MKTSTLIAATFGLLLSTNAFSQTPDLLGEPAANWHTYNQNKGQLINTDNHTEPDVVYYTEGTFPRIACWRPGEPHRAADPNPLISFWWTDVCDTAGGNDTTARIDFTVNGEGSAHNPPHAAEQADGLLNYYFPHTGSNGVKGVQRFQRVVYDDIYPNVDLELYSSEIGFKAYFVIHPGGDPNNIIGHFDGQDSITHDTLIGMRVYLKDKYLRLDQAFAYQYTGNSVTPLLWQPTFLNMGSGDFKFTNLGSYDPNQTMVFQLGGGMLLSTSVNTPQWCTYYGSDSEDLANDVKSDDEYTYMAGQTQSTNIPSGNGQSTVSTNGSGDGYVTCFESDYSIKWATVIGGSYTDGLEDIVLKTENDTVRIYGVGSSSGDGFPVSNIEYPQGYFEGGSNNTSSKAIIVKLNGVSGSSEYRSYFGGSSTNGYAITKDSEGNIYIGGSTSNSDINENAQCVFDGVNPDRFTVCNPFGGAYYQNFNGFDNGPFGSSTLLDGFIVKFSANDFGMEWSTLFGGHHDEVITDLAVDEDDKLYFTGRTKTDFSGDLFTTCIVPTNGDFPLCDAGGSALWQTSANGIQETGFIWDGFAGRFDDAHNIEWSTYIGGEDRDGASGVAVASNGDVYIVGWTETQDTIQVESQGLAPNEFQIKNNGSEYNQAFGGGQFDAWAWRLNSNLEPQWGSLIGGEGDELEYRAQAGFSSEIIRHEPNVAISDNDLVFINGFTTAPNSSSANEFPYTMGSGMYNQYGNNDAVNSDFDKSDAFLVGLDGNNDAIWSSYFGGSGFGASTDNANVGDAGDAITVQGNKIYIVGRTFSTEDFPHECPTGAYCNNNPSGVVNQDHSTAYIAQVNEKLWVLTNETVKENLEIQLSIYPNPFTEKVYIQLTEGSDKVNYSLLDITGKLVAKGTANQNQGIDFSHLVAGAYLLQIEGEQTQTFKVIKQ